MAYCIYNYLCFERCSVSAYEMVNSMKKHFSSKNSSFPLRGKSTANLLYLCSLYEVFLECTVVQLVEALRYKSDMPQIRFSMG